MTKDFKPLSETYFANEPLCEARVSQLLNGMKMTGSAVDAANMFQESFYINEAPLLFDFCKWIDNEIGGCGPINIQDLWYAFNHPQEQFSKNVAKHWKEEMEKINSYC